MQELVKAANARKAATILKALARRQMTGHFVETGEEALALLKTLLPAGCSVGWGGSATVDALGVKPMLQNAGYRLIDRDAAKTPAERMEKMRESLLADAFLMSTNAITLDGELLNIDGNGNRVAALCFGPRRVIVIAGMNKVVSTLDDAIARARHIAAPANLQRFDVKTPCNTTGCCADCVSPQCSCAQIVVTRFSMNPNRIKVVLVGENLGL